MRVHETPEPIFHLALRSDWEAAQAAGEYRVSTRGVALDDVGYLHASAREQVERIGALVYADVADDVVVLVIDPSQVGAEIRLENLEGGAERFPHVYGPLPVAAVTAELDAMIDADGRFTVPGLHDQGLPSSLADP